MCVYFVAMMCANRFGLGWAHDAFYVVYHMLKHFHVYVPSFIFILILICVGAFLHVSFFLSLFLLVSSSMAPKWKSTPSQNPLRSGASSSSDHTPPHVQFCDDTGHPLSERTFWRTFVDKAFIRNAKSSYRNFLILTYPLSFTIGVGGHFVTSRTLVPLWSYMSFTPIFTKLTLLYLISSLMFEVHA